MPFDSSGKWVDENADITSHMQGLLAPDSPLMQQAQAQARSVSHQRGLLNSSMAVGEGQKAMYNAAIPLATTMSNQASSMNLAGLNYMAQKSLADRQAEQATALAKLGYTAQDEQLTRRNAQEIELAKMQGATQTDLATLQNRLASERDTALANLNAGIREKEATALVTADVNATRQKADLATAANLVEQTAKLKNEKDIAILNNTEAAIRLKYTTMDSILSRYETSIRDYQTRPDLTTEQRTNLIRNATESKDSAMAVLNTINGSITGSTAKTQEQALAELAAQRDAYNATYVLPGSVR